MKNKNKHAVALGRLGGLASGKSKARTREQAQQAAAARWGKQDEYKGGPVTHGASVGGILSPEYRTWRAMRLRMRETGTYTHQKYSGRGITCCEAWMSSFEEFFKDMGKKPSPKHSIERIDNSKGYYPGNCRWALPKEQARNRRSSRMETYNGVTASLSEHVEKSGIAYQTVHRRLRNGWTLKDALETPVLTSKQVNIRALDKRWKNRASTEGEKQ